MKYPLSLRVNGEERRCTVEARTLLVDVLRDTFGLTGTRVGCDDSTCGSCTVLLDGLPVKSCTVLALQADSRSVVTVEALARGTGLPAAALAARAVIEALRESGSAGCGFCLPGQALAAGRCLERSPRPSRPAIREALRGNLCRCLGYRHIVDATEAAGRVLRGEGTAGHGA